MRDLTRYRADLVAARTAEKHRVEKLLEDAQIKPSVVASDIFGGSGRAMMAALVAGERDPKVLARMARTRMRAKLGLLEEAFYGRFSDHHAFLLAKMLGRVDQLSSDLAELEAHIEAEIAPFAQAADRLDEITGVGRTAACVIIAEIGVDMGRFPTPAHLASWARFAPGVKQSARKGKATTGHGNPYLARVLGEAAVAAGKTNTFLGERYRRITRRRGTNKAIVAVGRSVLIHRLAPAGRPRCPLPRPGPRLLRHPHQHRPQKAQPRPPAGGARLQGHPAASRLTGTHPLGLDPAPLRSTGCCRLPAHPGFSD